MAFRVKSPSKALEELGELASKYRITSFEAVDNILHVRYVRELFGEIAARNLDYRFFYEVKANLTPRMLRIMKAGGVRAVQPGSGRN